MNINKHKSYLVRILKDIYEDIQLGSLLGFKGGTALMLFYDLPRFSVDLDFHLIQPKKEVIAFERIRSIVLKYGKIDDEAIKHYGLIIVLDYGSGERKLKIEISTRAFENHYEIKNLLGISMNVMTRPDMFAHKICALLDRSTFTNRDLFDCWFFLQHQTTINKQIVEYRMKKSLSEYLQDCITHLEKMNDQNIMQGLGELLNVETKLFVKTKLRAETISLLKIYKDMPLLEKYL
ncbi:MAG: nucleotidyl transferase AbiEii/AbiGii toxin family protein [Chitinophagaceae bacterium]|nr:nucleotidyl transferase AbiEii/AbiGii toxin family protein [Chitinophagaceae bacterium]